MSCVIYKNGCYYRSSVCKSLCKKSVVSLKLKILPKNKKENIIILKFKHACSDLMEKIINHCRGVKKCNDGINRMKKEEQRENFIILLGFKENDIMNRVE